MTPGLAALVLQAQVIFTVILAAVVLRERASVRQWAGVAIGAAGLVVVGLGQAEHTPSLAVMITLAAALSWGIGNVVTRHAKISAGLSVVVWSALVVPLPLLALSLVLDGPAEITSALSGFGWAAALSTLFTVVLSTLFAYTVWYGLLARYNAAEVVPYILLVPPVGIVAAAVVLGEHPTPAEWVGAVVVLAGVAVATLTRSRPALPPAPNSSPNDAGDGAGRDGATLPA
jgi:O-acetylserine/cysteine efflux transporter